MNAWINNAVMNVKLTLRDRQALFWMYVFPVFSLFLFISIFGRFGPSAAGSTMAGLLCISTMAAGFFGLSIELVTARERGILRRYQMAPISPAFLISGSMVSSFLVILSSLLLQLLVARVVYDVRVTGSAAALLALLCLGALAFLSLGFVVAGVAKNAKVAQVTGNVLFFPLMFLGGATIPLQILPPTIRRISRLLPSTYMVDGLTQVITEGAGFGRIRMSLAVLAVTFAVGLFVASRLFRWSSNEPLPAAKKAWIAAIFLIFLAAAMWTTE